VDITLSKSTKWESGLYDMRPGLNKEIEKHKNAGFFIRNARNVKIYDSAVKWGNTCDSFGGTLDFDEESTPEIYRFSADA
ncbi:MAG: hypothetical protein K2G60_02440, partial [Oscillospiraceae bacterium]|nr:hypothetical protein [Oscillospiraceae bacterium]